MTFVTVGNATQGFRRLLDAVETLAGTGALPLPLVIQSGHNPGFTSISGVVRPFLGMEEFENQMSKADLVIGHAGAGTIIQALASGRVPVVMPRRAKYGELVDDHQAELVSALAEAGRIVPAWEPADLPAAISRAMREEPRAREGRGNDLLGLVSAYLDGLAR